MKPARTRMGTRAKIIALALVAVFIIPMMIVSMCASSNNASADLVQWVVCSWDDGDDKKSPNVFKTLYEYANTEDFQKMLFWKSEAGAEAESVHNLPNLMTGKDFDSVQVDILNTGNNTDKQYTPYDRFGFAGLNFTDYNGEWNWYKVYYCRANGKGTGEDKPPEDGHLNEYYKERKDHRPMDTFSGIAASKDPRVKHRGENMALLANNWNLQLANGLFLVTKCLTALVNLVMDMSLSDMATKLGVTDMVAGHGGTKGIFSILFENLFMQLMAMMMIGTALVFFFKAVLKRQLRSGMAGVATAIGCMIVGCMMMVAPVFFVNLPNNIGMFAQNILLGGMSNMSSTSGTPFCSTEGDRTISGSDDPQITGNPESDREALSATLQKSSDAIKRNLECEYYAIFALQPYALGQYGADYTNLWASGHAENGGAAIDNQMSGDYVGSAPVPLGGQHKVSYNWLLYQVSAQTNRHIDSSTVDQKTGEMKPPTEDKDKYTDASQYESQLTTADGTNVDWWRVVDAMANYKADANGNPDPSTQNQPLSYWGNWIGGNNLSRLLTAIMSIIFAIFGLLGPIALGLATIAYGIGSVLIMAFAPVALTLGMWAGHGQAVLKGWLQLLLTTVAKRVVMGFIFMLLTMFMIRISTALTSSIGYFKTMLMLCVVSYAIYHNRRMLAELLGRVNIGGTDLSSGMTKGINSLGKATRFGGQMAGSAAVGGALGAARKLGNGKGAHKVMSGVTKGAARSMARTLGHAAYGTQFGREYQAATNSQRAARGEKSKENIYCDNCGRRIVAAGQNMKGANNDYRLLKDGRLVCLDCANLLQGK